MQVSRACYRAVTPDLWKVLAPIYMKTLSVIVNNVGKKGPLLSFNRLFDYVQVIDLSKAVIYDTEVSFAVVLEKRCRLSRACLLTFQRVMINSLPPYLRSSSCSAEI